MSIENKTALDAHFDWKGKLEMVSRVPVTNKDELAVAYTPGVAQACLAIKDKPELSYELTRRFNTVAVITDGTAVLGLGDIGPEAGMPVMEGKCVLFKEFGNIDAIPLCVRSKDVDEIVKTVSLLAGSFGGINLEDISAPRCFEIERKLKDICDIPVFHDDQHGTAIVVLAGIINALKVVNKKAETVRVVISGAGAAGISIALLMQKAGFSDIVLCDKVGAIVDGVIYERESFNELAKKTNPKKRSGSLADILIGADVFIGVSAPNIVTLEMAKSMADKAIVFAMANPTPEIMPDVCKKAGISVIATGRSDFPNQINNLMAFPGIFRGALNVRAKDISESMKLAAAYALAGLIDENELSEQCIIPSVFDKRVVEEVAKATSKAAREEGLARI